MFSYKEYSNFFINIHIHEKTKFYTYKYLFFFKTILLCLKYIKLKYQTVKMLYNRVSYNRNNIFCSHYFNSKLYYLNNNKNNSNSSLYIKEEYIHKYNICYYFFIYYIMKEFRNLYLLEVLSVNSLHNSVTINCSKFSKSPSHELFKELKSISAIICFNFKTSSDNYYFNKIFFSHTLFNI